MIIPCSTLVPSFFCCGGSGGASYLGDSGAAAAAAAAAAALSFFELFFDPSLEPVRESEQFECCGLLCDLSPRTQPHVPHTSSPARLAARSQPRPGRHPGWCGMAQRTPVAVTSATCSHMQAQRTGKDRTPPDTWVAPLECNTSSAESASAKGVRCSYGMHSCLPNSRFHGILVGSVRQGLPPLSGSMPSWMPCDAANSSQLMTTTK